MPDYLTYSAPPAIDSPPFSGGDAVRSSMTQALSALQSGANYQSSFSLEAAAQAVALSQADLDAKRREDARRQLIASDDEQPATAASLDHELAVGSMIDDVTSIIDDISSGALALTPSLEKLLTTSFADMIRLIDAIPESLATEVGELGAAACSLLEQHGADSKPIIALFS